VRKPKLLTGRVTSWKDIKQGYVQIVEIRCEFDRLFLAEMEDRKVLGAMDKLSQENAPLSEKLVALAFLQRMKEEFDSRR
jgi:hypothetical protein